MLKDDGYLVLRNVIPKELYDFGTRYFIMKLHNNKLGRDDKVKRCLWKYGDTFSETLLETLTPIVSGAIDEGLHPTCSYTRVYLRGAVLERHRDRLSCEISVTSTLGYKSHKIWPIFIENKNKEKVGINLSPGDILIYLGVDLHHWRDEFDGDWCIQVFLHYVRKNGEYSDYKYDKRPKLGALATLLKP